VQQLPEGWLGAATWLVASSLGQLLLEEARCINPWTAYSKEEPEV